MEGKENRCKCLRKSRDDGNGGTAGPARRGALWSFTRGAQVAAGDPGEFVRPKSIWASTCPIKLLFPRPVVTLGQRTHQMPGTISCALPNCKHTSAVCILKTTGGDGWFNLLRQEFPHHQFETKRAFICICHFNEEDIEYVPKLKKDAIPNFKKEFDAVFAGSVKKEVSLTSITNGPAPLPDDGWDEMKKLFKSLFSPDQIKKLMGHKVDNWSQPMLEKGLRIRSLMSSSAYKKVVSEPTIALPSVTAVAHYANRVAGVDGEIIQDTDCDEVNPPSVKTYSRLNGTNEKKNKKAPGNKGPSMKKPKVQNL